MVVSDKTVLVEGEGESLPGVDLREEEVRYWRQRQKTGLSSATKKTSKWNSKSLGKYEVTNFCLIDFLYKERKKVKHSFIPVPNFLFRLKNNQFFASVL